VTYHPTQTVHRPDAASAAVFIHTGQSPSEFRSRKAQLVDEGMRHRPALLRSHVVHFRARDLVSRRAARRHSAVLPAMSVKMNATVPEGRSGMIRPRTYRPEWSLAIVARTRIKRPRSGSASHHRSHAGVRGDGEPPAVVQRYFANDDEWEVPV
jgi:hypothetical protein